MVADSNDMQDETRSFKVLTPGTTISHYRILGKIGEGGMGVVYKAEDTRLKRTVALKFLPPRLLCDADARTRFEHEAQSASALNHPNITTIYEIDDADGRCFIAMEYIEGKSVRQAAAAAAGSSDDILDMAIQIAKGLDAAHRKDVVHRDIKPDNIMVNNDGVVKITDFGLAKLKGVTKLTKEGTTVGTLQYMSPEQVLGKGVDRRSDIFSFGVVLYEMITGRLPFKGDDEAALINSILNETPEPLARYKADVPEGLQRIVDKALTKDREERYQHADEMVADLKREKRTSEPTAVTRIAAGSGKRKPMRRLLRILAPIIAVCVVVLLIFILEPFRIEVGPDTQAIAAENSLAVMYFENMVDPQDTDRAAKMIAALLITDLSESKYLEVMSRQRLFDILRALGKEDLKGIDESVASEVAKRAGVRWVLTGNVFQIEPNIVIASEISDVNSGKVVASQRVTGEKGEDVFAVVDRLSRAVKEDMALPKAAATSEMDRPVADVTTHSPEAYRYYMEGFDLFWKHYMDDAEVSLRKALEYDSTFAMANWALSYIVDEPEKSDLLARAVRHSDKASDLERGYIKAMAARHAGDAPGAVEILTELTKRHPSSTWPYMSLGVTYRELGEPEKAAAALRALLEIDPLDKEAYNQLAYTYEDAGDLENAIWAINQYIALAPDEANPYDSRGDLYAYNGRLDEALESYRKASEIKPLFSTSREGAMYLFKREYARAESCFNLMATRATPEARSNGRMMLALIPMHRGRFEEALRLLEDGLAADRMERYMGMAVAGKHRLMALIYMEMGNSEAAIEAARRCMEARAQVYPNAPAFAADFYMSTLYLTGHAEQAESLAAPYIELYAEHPEKATQADFTLMGLRELARGNTDEGMRYLERSIEAGEPYLHLRVLTARACIDAGRLGRAVELLEAALKRYDYTRATTPIWSVKAHYWLGLAYEGSGWKDKAAEQYETFLDIWKDADHGIPAVEDARQRLAGLKRET